jgi:hypothetical protein
MQMSARIFASVILTAASLALSPAAEADSNDRFWSGIAPSFNRPAEPPSARIHERSYERHYERARHERERHPTIVKRHSAPVEKAATVAYADGEGREYDPASHVWFDGDGECWRGDEAFSVRHGTWFYGSQRWHQVDGLWLTKTAPAPTRVDCRSITKFAAKLRPAPEQTAASTRASGDGEGLEHPGLDGQGVIPSNPPAEGAAFSPSACTASPPAEDGRPQRCDR